MSSEEGDKPTNQKEKKNNVLPLWGNERSMNLNPLILTNIQSSHYFKVNLYELKTYHEVIDEIYYKVSHLEPWEKGSRKTAGQTGMCGGVRGVGAGGIVSTAYCLLYKLFTLKLTRKQVNGLLTHPDSPYIRALGFMYIRYSQPPADLWDWYDEYLQDPEEMDVKAGGGHVMTIGNMLHHFLTKLEWFSTLFPRIPVPIQQKLARQLSTRFPQLPEVAAPAAPTPQQQQPSSRPGGNDNFGEAERVAKLRRSEGEGRSPSLGHGRSPRDSPSHHRDRERETPRDSPRDREKSPRGEKRSSKGSSPVRKHRRNSHDRYGGDQADYGRRDYEQDHRHDRYDREESRHRSRGDRNNGQSRDKDRHHRSHRNDEHGSSRHRSSHHHSKDFASELAREKDRQEKQRDRSRDRTSSRHSPSSKRS